MRSTLPTVLLVSLLAATPAYANSSGPTGLKPIQIESERRFKNYDDAVRYVRSHYARESIDTNRSSWITSAEYFYADGRGYLILGMKRKPYIFAGVPREVWEGFKVAPSLGRYYHQRIKGRYRFNL